MRIVGTAGRENVATVFIGETRSGRMVEFVEAVQPPVPRGRKWVLMVSTLYGCPVGCPMCDAGGFYGGRISKEDIEAQIDFLVRRRYPDGTVPVEEFKIQFARMGEPALNPAVTAVLEGLPERYRAPGLLPSISTVAPRGAEAFFERLLAVKRDKFSGGRFQFQFSIHTTDEDFRRRLVPAETWSFREMAAYGERFFEPGDLKITLNFALADGVPLEASRLREYFDPDLFLIKMTPLNPTYRAAEHGLRSSVDPRRDSGESGVVEALREAGYRVIVSVGEMEENLIGSNCGQYLRAHLEAARRAASGTPAGRPPAGSYTYPVRMRS